MPIASANPFPSMLYVEGTTPTSPSSGQQRLFVRSSDHVLCMVNSSGTVTPLSGSLTNPMTTKGDVIIGDTAGAPTRLAAGATAGMVLTSAGSGAFETFSLPPGYEYSYNEITSTVNITATVEASANTIATATAFAGDGATIIMIEAWFPYMETAAANDAISVFLFDGSTSLGFMARVYNNSGPTDLVGAAQFKRRLTPSNASHTYSARAVTGSGTATVGAGAGTAGNWGPGFIRITKV